MGVLVHPHGWQDDYLAVLRQVISEKTKCLRRVVLGLLAKSYFDSVY